MHKMLFIFGLCGKSVKLGCWEKEKRVSPTLHPLKTILAVVVLTSTLNHYCIYQRIRLGETFLNLRDVVLFVKY